MLQEHTYSTPQELVTDCTQQLSLANNLPQTIDEQIDAYELFDRLVELAGDDEFAGTYIHFLELERLQNNLDFVKDAVFAA